MSRGDGGGSGALAWCESPRAVSRRVTMSDLRGHFDPDAEFVARKSSVTIVIAFRLNWKKLRGVVQATYLAEIGFSPMVIFPRTKRT